MTSRRQWTTEQLATLKRMWLAGASTEDIGRATGNRSGDTIRGQRSRMGLPVRGKPKRVVDKGFLDGLPRSKSAPRVPTYRIRDGIRPTGPRSSQRKVVVFTDVVAPIRFVDRKPYSQCAFIADDACGVETMCCGRPSVPGSSWCPGHHDICMRVWRA